MTETRLIKVKELNKGDESSERDNSLSSEASIELGNANPIKQEILTLPNQKRKPIWLLLLLIHCGGGLNFAYDAPGSLAPYFRNFLIEISNKTETFSREGIGIHRNPGNASF